ncbi:MAG: tetrahydrofolate dehydrogenase/cyclohydrolase catalytic domain-containing protein, partial [Burkholderiaceae bacterium]|nr:tetrahydrofolate dehydrogenase/cyclohydrolase catalytic domain-containing protein [Burkholderiaceae bacterium]
MTAQIINGNLLAQEVRADIAKRAAALTAQGEQPGLAVILVGDSAASMVYVMNKEKACIANGFYSVLEKYDADFTEAELLERIEVLNNDPKIHGILVQLPIPDHIDERKVIEAIKPEKDMDCFNVVNAGNLMVGHPTIRPCTPYGVMKMLESINYPIRGAHAVIVGASNIVGKPMAMMLLQAGATITICNSKTRDLAFHTRLADILIAATGKRNLITADMIKPGAVVIDVG